MSDTITIDPEFRDLVRPLAGEEIAGLTESIKTEGCREPLLTWLGILVDGHHRIQICQENGIPYQTREMQFTDRADVKIWIIKNQFARRNLSAVDRSLLALELEPLLAAKAKERQATHKGGDVYLVQNSAQAEKTRDELATPAPEDRTTPTTTEKADILQELEPLLAAKAKERQIATLRQGDKIPDTQKSAGRGETRDELAAPPQEAKPPAASRPSRVVQMPAFPPDLSLPYPSIPRHEERPSPGPFSDGIDRAAIALAPPASPPSISPRVPRVTATARPPAPQPQRATVPPRIPQYRPPAPPRVVSTPGPRPPAGRPPTFPVVSGPPPGPRAMGRPPGPPVSVARPPSRPPASPRGLPGGTSAAKSVGAPRAVRARGLPRFPGVSWKGGPFRKTTKRRR